MLDNFLNVLLVNNMNGSKSYACCECGYEERDVNRNLRICPECGAFRAYGSDVLSFGDIQYAINSGMAIRNFNNKDLYRFYIIHIVLIFRLFKPYKPYIFSFARYNS